MNKMQAIEYVMEDYKKYQSYIYLKTKIDSYLNYKNYYDFDYDKVVIFIAEDLDDRVLCYRIITVNLYSGSYEHPAVPGLAQYCETNIDSSFLVEGDNVIDLKEIENPEIFCTNRIREIINDEDIPVV